jgi:hypothetical protein
MLRCSFTMPRGVLKVMDAVVTRSRISSEIKIEGDTAPLVVIGRRGVPMAASILLEHFQEYGTLAELAPRQDDAVRGGSAVAGNGGEGDGCQA